MVSFLKTKVKLSLLINLILLIKLWTSLENVKKTMICSEHTKYSEY